MRWERLFADLEAASLDEAALERDALAEELVDEEWSTLTGHELLWGEVSIEVMGAGRVTGEVVEALADLVMVDTGHSEVAVARAAVVGWRGGSGRAPAPTPVTARLGWAQLLRSVRDESGEAQVVRVDGSHVTGRVSAVARDAVQVEAAGGLTWVPLRAVATLRID